MLMNNLDPEVAEKPRRAIVYGGTQGGSRPGSASTPSSGRCALENDETLPVQSGSRSGVFTTLLRRRAS